QYISICFPFNRFRDGLMSLGVLDALQRYPLQMKCLFVKENLFWIIHSERGSNALLNCVTLFLCLTGENNVSLQDILVFMSGCDSVPALGFSPKPSLEFISHSRFPQANTCENILRIPIHSLYKDFKSDMDFAIPSIPIHKHYLPRSSSVRCRICAMRLYIIFQLQCYLRQHLR
uniref:HECT domain-containing protein n=1 Tax=Cynoglossus semilaevis TaxID=244447 RepID=A0A3P8VID6_CYNSE